MNITGASVRYDYPEFIPEGQPKWANAPSLEIDIDEPLTPRNELRYEEKNGMYYADDGNGIVHTIYKPDITKPDQGFGGSGFSVTMIDGTTRKWSGGWHSNPEHIHSCGFPMVIDCAIGTPQWEHVKMAAWITVELADFVITKYQPEWELYLRYNHGLISPGLKRKDRPPKHPQKWAAAKRKIIEGLSSDQADIVRF